MGFSMFEFAKPALESAGVKVAESWDETKSQTLRAARAQLARRDLRPATAAKWNKAVFVVSAQMGRDSKTDPRVTARQR